MPYDCFISYSSQDLKLAEELHKKLTTKNYKVWFDKARLQPGFDWHKEIEQGCENSRVLLPILTPRWKNSEWTKYETYGAEAVIPLIFDGEWKDISTPPLEQFQAEKLDFSSSGELNLERLFNAINRVISQPIPQKTNKTIHLHYRTNDYFVGREKELIKIHEELHSNPTASLTQGRVRVITANGGYGKTTLARHYAEKFWKCYTQIFWVDTRLGYENEFAHIHDILFPDLANIGLKETDKANRVLQEFNSQEKRLLILDNAEDEETAIKWIPKSGSCHTIITSRFASWSAGVKTFPIWVLDKEPSIQFLLQRSDRRAEGKELEACYTLSEKLGYLPLAIEQAAAYIFKQGKGFGFADYLEMFTEAEKDLLALKASGGSTEYPDAIFSTWKTSIQKMPNCAKAIFRLCSFLAATPIPLDMFIKNDEILAKCLRFLENGIVEEAATDELEKPSKFLIRQWKDVLADYSLIALTDDDTFKIHTLVQAVERFNIPKKEYDEWLKFTFDAVENWIPLNSYEHTTWTIWDKMLLHIETLIAHSPELNDKLLESLSDYLGSQGSYNKAEFYCQAALDVREKKFGKENPSTLTSINKLGILLQAKGAYEQAEILYRRALEARERILGKENPETLTSIFNLAALLTEKGNYEEAEKLHRWELEVSERILGKENPSTLISLNNLALLLYDKKDYIGAEKTYRTALEIFQKILGNENPETLNTKNNLAILLSDIHKYEEADQLFKEVLEGREKVFGISDKRTAHTARNLADLYKQRYKSNEAEYYFRKAIEYYESSEFKDNRNLGYCMNELGVLVENNYHYSEAKELYNKALPLYRTTRGIDDKDTLIVFYNLISRCSLEEKVPLYLSVYNELEKKLPQTDSRLTRIYGEAKQIAVDINNAALNLRNEGLLVEAENNMQMAIEIDTKIQGANHPIIAHRLNNLSTIQLMQNRISDSNATNQRAWQIKNNNHDITSLRILTLKLVLRWLEKEDGSKFIGQIKNKINDNPFVYNAGVSDLWDIKCMTDFLENKLPAEYQEFLIDLITVLNKKREIEILDHYKFWKKTKTNKP
ncbi:MAG: toll/interleukin-1 receptor domain-containing protein [bacterium]